MCNLQKRKSEMVNEMTKISMDTVFACMFVLGELTQVLSSEVAKGLARHQLARFYCGHLSLPPVPSNAAAHCWVARGPKAPQAESASGNEQRDLLVSDALWRGVLHLPRPLIHNLCS